MGADLFDSRDDLLGERADEILGFTLRDLCLNGPEEELTSTENAQPALFALSFALWDTMVGRGAALPSGAAGHSLGEYTALTAAGVFDFDTALALVALRGRAMARAAGQAESGMAALIGADRAAAEEISRTRRESGGRLQVANVNAPGQVVVAGGKDDIEWLVSNAGELGVRRAMPLAVSGAFHSGFMEPAREELASALVSAEIEVPRFPVWSNTTGLQHQADGIRGLLERQLTEPVLFLDSLLDMSATGIDTFIHVGPGDVTAGLARRTVGGATVQIVSEIGDIPAALEAVGTMGKS
jgi:[acyl-carrier-protein] S-malonyltransferase